MFNIFHFSYLFSHFDSQFFGSKITNNETSEYYKKNRGRHLNLWIFKENFEFDKSVSAAFDAPLCLSVAYAAQNYMEMKSVENKMSFVRSSNLEKEIWNEKRAYHCRGFSGKEPLQLCML